MGTGSVSWNFNAHDPVIAPLLNVLRVIIAFKCIGSGTTIKLTSGLKGEDSTSPRDPGTWAKWRELVHFEVDFPGGVPCIGRRVHIRCFGSRQDGRCQRLLCILMFLFAFL